MAEHRTARSSTRRRAVYSYLRPLIEGRRVAELRCGTGEGAAHLLALGAHAVLGLDDDRAAVEQARHDYDHEGLSFAAELSPIALEREGPFDVIVVPEAAAMLRRPGALRMERLRQLLGDEGRLVCVVANGDAAEGNDAETAGYYDLHDALEPHFAKVRMFGQTPFLAFGMAEFDEAAAGGLRLDSGLVDEAAEQPTHYLAVAGPDEELALGYALVQIPHDELPGGDAGAANGSLAALRRSLVETEGKLDGALRVSRAQAEEIEELRARLRRAAEARAELDDEASRLRRSLAEADESVLSLTRRTTEQVTALTQRLTAGLRGPGGVREEAPHAAALADRLREQEAKLAARESALSERDERVAALEAERQDLLWRLESAEENLRREPSAAAAWAPAPAAAAGATGAGGAEAAAAVEDLRATIRVREQALEEYRRAATVHLDEVARLRDALTEQSAAVSELEEGMRGAEARIASAEHEAARLRAHAAETEDADRQRRSRLAELEGTLLRLQRQAAMQADRRAAEAAAAAAEGPAPPVDAEAAAAAAGAAMRVIELEGELRSLRLRIGEVEAGRDDAERRWRLAAARIDEVEHSLRLKEAAGEAEAVLRARISELEGNEGTEDRLDAALAEVDRLRNALERSEEQLWEARGRLLSEQERAGGEGGEGGTGAPSRATLVAEMLAELESLETGLRAEAAQLAAVERSLIEWRSALTRDGETPAAAPAAGES
jgi:SAM-dependent methyltransferase